MIWYTKSIFDSKFIFVWVIFHKPSSYWVPTVPFVWKILEVDSAFSPKFHGVCGYFGGFFGSSFK